MSPKMHAIVDYILGPLFILAPWIFGFAVGGVAHWLLPASGVLILAISLCTRYELSILKVIPLQSHLTTDLLLGILLVLAPWVLGFATTIIWPYAVAGIMEILAGIFTKSIPAEGFQSGTKSSRT